MKLHLQSNLTARHLLQKVAVAVGLLCVSAVACADCYEAAAQYQHVNPQLLRAIAWQESHNRADSLHYNSDGTVDYGIMQINSIHLTLLSRYGITSTTLMDPCKNVYVAAWHLRQKMNKYGNTWSAVGAYHSETPALRDGYAKSIARILLQWGSLPQ